MTKLPLRTSGSAITDSSCENSCVDERAFYRESQTTKPSTLNCPFCRTSDTYELRWLVRRKIDRLPGKADERDRAKFAKAASYMVLLDDKTACKNPRCRRTFEVSGIKTTAFLTD
jgi:hypothetical protein